MRRSHLSFVFCLSFACLFCGCDCRNSRPRSFQDDLNVEYVQQNRDNFERAIASLNSLEESPCLPGTPGIDRLVRTADRLNKWIRDRAVDEFWEPDPLVQSWSTLASEAAKNARESIRLLWFLQGRDESGEELLDAEGNPAPLPDSMDEQRKRIVVNLKKLGEQLHEMERRFDSFFFAVFATQIEEHQKDFQRLEALPNLNPMRLRNYTRQWDSSRLLAVAETLEKFASELEMDGRFFHVTDADYVKQCFWARNVSQWACGDRHLLLDRAYHLFDWTVCNIDTQPNIMQLNRETRLPLQSQLPWQSMLLGRGTQWDRVWIFIELLRQQRIDACLLASSASGEPGMSSIWGIGVLLDDEIYVFLPSCGIPLPGPEGPKIEESGELTFPQIATFSQARENDGLFRRLDLSGEEPFPVNAEQLKNLTIFLVASSETTSMRMKLLEKELSGDDSAVLYTDLREQRRRFEKAAGDVKIELWNHPGKATFEQLLPFHQESFQQWIPIISTDQTMRDIFMRPHPITHSYPLWTGRILYFKGRVTGQDGAVTFYQGARVSERDIMEFREKIPEFRMDPMREQELRFTNATAMYWLGLSSFELDSIPAAKDHFDKVRLEPISLWREGCEYMLGRIAEREKRYEDADSHYARIRSGLNFSVARVRSFLLRQAVPPGQ